MNRFCNQFLAGAALALQQHGGARRGDLLHNVKNLLHRRRLADDVFQAELGVELLVQRNIFHFELLLAQRAGDAHFQLINLQTTLGDVVVRAALHGLDRDFFRTVGGHQDADRRFGQRFGARDELHAVLVGQAKIREHHVEVFAFEQAERGLRVFGHINIVTIFERGAQSVARRLFIVHNQQGGLFGHGFASGIWAASRRGLRSCSGSQIRKVVPRPSRLSSSMRPPWVRTMRCTIIRPRPVPFFLVV